MLLEQLAAFSTFMFTEERTVSYFAVGFAPQSKTLLVAACVEFCG